jgi:hypothetical protein
VDTNAVTRTDFGKDVTKSEFASVLLYKLRRKKQFESDDQSNADNTFTKDTSTDLHFLVIWRSNNEWSKFSVRTLLIKHSNTITWNEDKLEKLHSMYLNLLKDDQIVRDTWLLDDVTVLMTILRRKVRRHTIEITITEGTREDDSMEPLWIPSSI